MAPDNLFAPTTILPAATALFELAATFHYLRAVARGETRPSRTTWLIWTPLAWLTVAGSVEAGAGATLVKLVASALGVTAIAALALFRGTGRQNRLGLRLPRPHRRRGRALARAGRRRGRPRHVHGRRHRRRGPDPARHLA